MAVSTQYSPLLYAGNGVATSFAVSWPFFSGTLVVTEIVIATGVETVESISTHYTVSGGSSAPGTPEYGVPTTGTVTAVTAPPSTVRWRITRVTPKTQAGTWNNNDAFPAKLHEVSLDKLTLIAQEGVATAFADMTGDFMQLDTSGATDFWDAQSQIIRNVADGVLDTDAVTKQQLDAAAIVQFGGGPIGISIGGTSANNAEDALANLGGVAQTVFDEYVEDAAEDVERDLGNVVSLLSVLTDAEVADVLAGTNLIDITAKIKTLISTAPEGAYVDCSMLNGVVTLTSTLFTDHTKRIYLDTGFAEIRNEFNDSGGHRIPSFCTWEMNGKVAPTTKLNNPGGATFANVTSPALGMVQTYWGGVGRTCGGTSAGTSLVVSDATGIHVGTRIAILGILADTTLTYTLTNAETSGATTLELTGAMADEIEPMLGNFLIGTEIVRGLYTGGSIDASAAGFTGEPSGRGMYGTTAASHSATDVVTVLQSQLATVTAMAGTTLTIDQPLARTFTGAYFRFGAVNARLTGIGEIDGEMNRSDPSTNVWECFASTLGSGCTADGRLRLRRGATGGIMLRGCKECNFYFDLIEGCGVPGSGLGASVWFFGGNYDCTVNARHVHDGNIAVAPDNKSAGVTSMGLDQPNFRCVSHFDEVTSHINGIDITGSHDGVHVIGHCQTSAAAIGIFDSTPQSDAIASAGNYVRVETQDTYRAIVGNALANNTIVDHPPQATLTDAATVTWDTIKNGRQRSSRWAATARWRRRPVTRRVRSTFFAWCRMARAGGRSHGTPSIYSLAAPILFCQPA